VGSFFSDKEEDLSAYTLITITDSHTERIREQQHEGENNTGFMAPRLIRRLSPGILFAFFMLIRYRRIAGARYGHPQGGYTCGPIGIPATAAQ
jgi:hypothetical protein